MFSKRAFSIIQNVIEFFIVLTNILFGFLQRLIELILPKKLKEISSEIVLITGTGHGIGRELALHYASHGCTVICIDINKKNNAITVDQAKNLNIAKIFSYTCDVTNRQMIFDLAETIKKDIGLVTVLINNVGIMPTHPLELHTPQEIEKVFNVNVYSQFWAIQAFLPHMKQQHRGHIIAMSSLAGTIGLTNLVPYCATKFAVRGLMEALYEEIRLGPYRNEILCTTIYPYMTDTGLCKKPVVKFPSILHLLDPKIVAKIVVEAHRSNTLEASVPTSLLYINYYCRCLPVKCALLLKDFIGGGVESDL